MYYCTHEQVIVLFAGNTNNMGYVCPKCGHIAPGDAKALIWHLRHVHHIVEMRNFTESITCGQDGCERTFSGRTYVFQKHLRNHRDVQIPLDVALLNHNSDSDNGGSDDEVGNNLLHEDVPIVPLAAEHIWENFSADEVEKRASMLVAGMLASSSTAHSTVTDVVEKTADLIDDISSYIKHKVQMFATASGIPVDDENLNLLIEDVEAVSQPFRKFETEYRQKTFFQHSDTFLQAEELPLGIGYYPCNNPITGNVLQVMKTISFQYIPIKPLLKLILEKTDILKIVSAYRPSNDTLLRDFHDGSYCRESEFLSQTNTIKLILYNDDFEVTNPLSPKAGTHKLGAVYFTIANVPPKYRSTLTNMFLLMLYTSSDAKMYGYEPLLAQFIVDMNSLSTDGLDIRTEHFDGNIKVGIAQVVGDNLGIHSLFGFAEGFTANYSCRICKMHRNDTRQELIENSDLIRTSENYQIDVDAQNLQETGIKKMCPLHKINNFHVTHNRAPDVMHDLLEGVCPLELKLVLAELINKDYFTIETFNARIISYNYGLPDKRNKPCPYTMDALRRPDGAPGQNAGQMWCLMRHIPLILGDLVPLEDDHWELLLSLLDCMDIIFSPIISRGETIYLEQLIADHHKLYLHLFPNRHLKPKHHFMTHYPSATLLYGPLIHLWVMRFEAFHNFSRRLSHIVCNFQNVSKTLAHRNQMLLCYNLMSKKTLVEKTIEVGPGESVLLASLENAATIAQNLGIALYDEIYVAKWCKVHGTEYRKNLMVLLDKADDGAPVFGKIMHVLSFRSTVSFICELWQSVGFDRHYHAYIVQLKHPQDIVFSDIDNLIDFHPFQANKSYKKDCLLYYISPRYSV